MKKVLALVLAVVLAFGMTTVAFAATTTYEKDTVVVTVGSTAYVMNSDDEVVTGSLPTTIKPGDTIYIPVTGYKTLIKNADDTKDSGVGAEVKTLKNVSDLKDLRVSYSIDDGKNMIASAKFVKVDSKLNGSKAVKELFIALESKDNFIMENQSVDLTIKVSAKNDAFVLGGTDATNGGENGNVSFAFTNDYGYDDNSGDAVDNGFFTVGDKTMLLSFDDEADDVTLCFEEDVEVWGNMKGQKDVIVHMATGNDAIEEKYPDATIRFFDSTKDTFRRDVTVTLPYESTVEKPYLYVVDAKGNLTKIFGGSNADKAATESDVKYDDVTGAFVFKTNTLNNYVISETELKNVSNDNTDTDAPAEGDKPTDGAQPNPGTGANDFVGLAVALAVVSVAGIAVAKRK